MTAALLQKYTEPEKLKTFESIELELREQIVEIEHGNYLQIIMIHGSGWNDRYGDFYKGGGEVLKLWNAWM